MEEKSKEELDKKRLDDKKIKREARVAAEKSIMEEELKEKKRKKKELEDRLKKIKRTSKNCKSSEEEFKIKIKYRCKSVCGKKYYIFNNDKSMFPFIDKYDIVLYDNPKHSNHNREAIVINYNMGGTGSKDFDKNKTKPYFLIKFIEPLDKLPFYYLDVNGLKVKTNKKIVFMNYVSYDNLKLVYSTTKSDIICLLNGKFKEKNDKKDIEKILQEKYDNENYNSELNFRDFVNKTFDDTNEIVKKVQNEKILSVNKKNIKIDTINTKLKEIIKYIKNPSKTTKKEEDKFKKITEYFNTILDHPFNISIINKNNGDLNQELIIYIYIYDLLSKKSKKNLKYIKKFKDNIEDKNNIIIELIKIIKKIQKNLNNLNDFFFKKYEKIFKDVDEYIKKKIMNIVTKNLANKSVIKPYTYKHFIIDKLKKIVRKYFKIGEEFEPAKVFFKYANPELVKLSLKDQLTEEKEVEKQFIKINQNNKLVNPTSDKIFILTNINSVFNANDEKKIIDIDDYFTENVKINTKLKQIEIKLDIGLTIKDKKSKDIIFEDNIKDGSFLNSIKKIINSVQENLECTKSKENLQADIKKIKEQLGYNDENTTENTTENTK